MPVVAKFAPSSKYLKSDGVMWIREFLGIVNPKGFTAKADMTEEDLRELKMPVSKAVDFLCLAVNMDKEAWLPHREHLRATEMLQSRYTALGCRIQFLSYDTDLKQKGFYTVREDSTIICLALTTCDAE
eukprot:8230604-Lingulodinium_polyedra.AAC.1